MSGLYSKAGQRIFGRHTELEVYLNLRNNIERDVSPWLSVGDMMNKSEVAFENLASRLSVKALAHLKESMSQRKVMFTYELQFEKTEEFIEANCLKDFIGEEFSQALVRNYRILRKFVDEADARIRRG